MKSILKRVFDRVISGSWLKPGLLWLSAVSALLAVHLVLLVASPHEHPVNRVMYSMSLLLLGLFWLLVGMEIRNRTS